MKNCSAFHVPVPVHNRYFAQNWDFCKDSNLEMSFIALLYSTVNASPIPTSFLQCADLNPVGSSYRDSQLYFIFLSKEICNLSDRTPSTLFQH